MKIVNSKQGVLIAIPTLGRPVGLEWALSFKSQNPPINFNTQYLVLKNRPVDEARQELCEYALKNKFKYIYFLGDDVVPPSFALRNLIYRMEQDETIGVCGGIYFTKSEPPFPLVFKENGSGSYWDWKVGEFFEVTGIGMDCTLIRVSILENLSKPWFKTVDEDLSENGLNRSETWTEDLYFCKKVCEETNYKIFADASIICEHWDFPNNKCYTIPPCSKPTMRLLVNDKALLDIGCGEIYYKEYGFKTVRVDIREEVNPDYRCDVRNLPFGDDSFDKVRASHVLEHFGHEEHTNIIYEWKRVLKPNCKIEIIVPDIEWAFRNMNRVEANWVLYGAQLNPYDFHKSGFTENSLKELLTRCGFKDVEIERDSGYNLFGRGVK
jgi:predicted SAM-dependent methyltransferase